jgi:Rab family protein
MRMRSSVTVSGQIVHFELWDTAGQETYLSLVPIYVRGASCCVLVCSIVDPESIEQLDRWRDKLKECDDSIPCVLAVNKIDLADQDPDLIDRTCASLQTKYTNIFLVSALRGSGITELFTGVGEKCLARGEPVVCETLPTPRKEGPEEPASGGCC